MQPRIIANLWRTCIHLSIFLTLIGCGRLSTQNTSLQNASGLSGSWLSSELGIVVSFQGSANALSSGTFSVSATDQYVLGAGQKGTFEKNATTIFFNSTENDTPFQIQYTCSYQFSGNQLNLSCDGNSLSLHTGNYSRQ